MKWSIGKQLGLVGFITVLLLGGCRTSRQPSGPLPEAHLPNSTVSPAIQTWPRTFTDDLGNTVTLARPPQRVITLQPNLAEIIALVGAIDQLVGVTEFCNYPPEAAAKAKVGGIINPSLEKIVGLQPDLVLVSRGNDMAFIRRLAELDISVLGYDPQTLPDVIELVRRLGEVTGHQEQAEQAAQDLRERYETVLRQASGRSGIRLRVLFVLSWEPLFVAGATSFVNDMITAAGGENAVRQITNVDQKKPWPQISREAVVAANAQAIISTAAHGKAQAAEAEQILHRLKTDPGWQQVTAVKQGQVYIIDDDLVTIPGPRLIDGLETISVALARATQCYEGQDDG